MKIPYIKAVAALLFLFAGLHLSAQKIVIRPVDTLKVDINEFRVYGFRNLETNRGTPVRLNDTIEKEEFLKYDSFYVMADGYNGEWIRDVKIPNINTEVITLKVVMKPFSLDMEEEVVVSAARFTEKRDDVAQQIDIINRRNIEFASQGTTADLLQDNGNVMVQRSQLGGGSPIIRGFEANKVLIVVDGVRMNNAIYRGGHLQNILRVDNNSLEKVEIVQGPGSVLYGSDALGGVMHFMTLNPELRRFYDTTPVHLKAGAMARYGTAASQLSGNLNFNLGWERFAWLSSFSYSQLGDLRQGTIGLGGEREAWKNNYYVTRINGRDTMLLNTKPEQQTGSGYEQLDVLQKFYYRGDRVTHLLNFQYSETGNVPRYDRLNLTDSAANAQVLENRFLPESPDSNQYQNAEWYYGPEQRLLLAYTLGILKDDAEAGKITAAYQDIKESRHSRGWNKFNRTDRHEHVGVVSLNADFQAFRGKNEFRYGAEAAYNFVTSRAETINIESQVKGPASTRYPADGSNMFFGGLYAVVNREFKKRWVANLGVRANLVTLNASFGDSALTGFAFTGASQRNFGVNYQAGLVYNDSGGFRIALRAGSGFRAPNIDDMGKVFDSDPKNKQVIVPNKDLKSEITNTFELTVGKSMGRKLLVEATGWYTIYSNAIVLRPYTFNGMDSIDYDGVTSRAYANQNAASAYLYGASLRFRWNFIGKFSVNGSATYTYGRVSTDSTDYPLDHIPPIFGRAGIRWNNKRIDAEFFTLFNGPKGVADYNMTGEDNFFDATINGMPSWYTLNVRAAYKLNPFATIQVAAENLLDQNYRVFASGISAPGLNFIVTLRVQL